MTSTVQYAQATASFQPPPTQNTAPIVEHRCLYTQDLRRKAKRWQDGILRFHTFNKRVMVYDVPRNFIGDTHWREDYPVQYGDEFELDRPVLVQVGEQVGSIDQDLTELFEKRHKKHTLPDEQPGPQSSSPPIPPRSSGLRPSSAVTGQLVPKSLNALLGTPKGRIGRATLPTKSPYELRLGNAIAGRNLQPQAKRQRTGCTADRAQQATNSRAPLKPLSVLGKENASVADKIHDSSIATESSNTDRAQTIRTSYVCSPSSKPYTTAETFLTSEATTSLSSLTNESPHTVGIKRNGPAAQDDETRYPQQAKTRKPEERTRLSIKEPTAPKPPASPKIYEPSNIIHIPSDTESSPPRSNERISPKIRLQIAYRKPRRKLMYRDLLPPDALAARNIPKRNQSNGSDTGRRAQSARNPHPKQRGAIEKTRETYKRVRRKSEGSVLSFTDDGDSVDDDAHRVPVPAAAERDAEPQKELVTEIPDDSRSSFPEITDFSTPRVVPAAHNTSAVLAQMDEILLSQTQVLAPTMMKQRSPLQKSISDVPRTTILKERSPLQKSNSDMPRTTMTRSVSNGIKSNSIASAPCEATEQVISPWSREAWDLFGCGRDGQAVDFATFCMNEDV